MRLEIQRLLHQGKHAAVKFIQIIYISLPATIVVVANSCRKHALQVTEKTFDDSALNWNKKGK